MCGLNGIYAYRPGAPAVDPAELRTTRDQMTARGPDGAGHWLAPDRHLGLGHRRLAIIDLSAAAAQPMASADGRYHLVFNGEIYNYRALRQQLQAAGAVFRTHSDTEVLLHLYAQHGPAMLPALRGMFAIAIWDSARRQLCLARDPYGIKPLYYADTAGTLRFASQVKALLAGGALSREPDPAGQVGFYLFGSVPEPFTWYQDIRALPAGHSLIVDARGPGTPTAYHRIAQVYADAEAQPAPSDPAATQLHLRAALLDSVRHHLEADVPVGAFLSAGIDSGALVGLMRDAGAGDLQTLTLAFEEFQGRPDDEAPLAAEVARHYGTRHTTRTVTAQEFQDDLPRILAAMDQPSIDGINTWFIAKAARELGLKVAVSGLGGDELFGGYPSFTDIPRWVRWLAPTARLPALGKTLRRLTIAALNLSPLTFNLSPKLAGLLEYGGTYPGAYLLRRGLFMPWELDQPVGRWPGPLLDPDIARAGLERLDPFGLISAQLHPGPRGVFASVATLESSLYMRNQLLRDTDWAGMAHSLEIRVPLVDAHLLAQAAPLIRHAPANAAKGWLAAAPTQPLPATIVQRKKTGFGIPIGRWIGNPEANGARLASADSRAWARRLGQGSGTHATRPLQPDTC